MVLSRPHFYFGVANLETLQIQILDRIIRPFCQILLDRKAFVLSNPCGFPETGQRVTSIVDQRNYVVVHF